MELFRLFGSIMINDDDAIKTLKDAETSSKESAKAMQDLTKKAGEMGKKIAIGVTAAVTSLGAMVVKSVEATDRIDKMSQKLGMSTEGFQEWDYILGQNGISIDSLQGGMKTLTNMTDELMNGSKTATDSFGRLGISMEDLAGKSQEEVFTMTVSALQGVTNETERAALANDLLGRSGSEMAPLLNQGAGAVDDLRQRAHDLGLVIDQEAVTAGVVLGDTMDDVKKSFGTVVTQIGVEVMPIFQSFLNWILDHMPVIKEVTSTVFNAVADAIKWVMDNANWLIPVLGGLAGSFLALSIINTVTTLMGQFKNITTLTQLASALLNTTLLANPFAWVALLIGGLVAAGIALWMNWDTVKEKAVELWQSMKDIFGKIRDFVGDVWNNIKSAIKLPSISIQGDLNPLTWLKNGIPKFNVNWNAEGAIFAKPAIFDTRYGYQGVGEAGAEVVMPLSKLDSMLSERKGNQITVNFYPQSMSESELDNAFKYINRRFGMEV